MIFGRHRRYQDLSDAALVAAVTGGDKDAVVYMFYTKFAATFQYHIFKLFNDGKVDVADVVDEFLLYLHEDDWRRLRTYDPSRSALSTWISSVSFRFFKNYRQTVIESAGTVPINESWDFCVAAWVQNTDEGVRMDVENVLSALPGERDRAIARRLLIEDAEYEAVAQEFGLTVDYVYTVKNRILKKLREKLEGYERN